jgi:hypothetical protein
LLLPAPAGGGESKGNGIRIGGAEKGVAGGEERQGAREDKAEERKNRGERENRFPKDLYAISENCRGSFVKQNFPLI